MTLDIRQFLSHRLDRRIAARFARRRERFDQELVCRMPARPEILALAHKLGQRACTCRKADRHLRKRVRRCRILCGLQDQECFRGERLVPRRVGESRPMCKEHMLYKIRLELGTGAIPVPDTPGREYLCSPDQPGSRLSRILQSRCDRTPCELELGEAHARLGHVSIVFAPVLLTRSQCPLQERLGPIELPPFAVDLAQALQRDGGLEPFGSERLLPDRERTCEHGFGFGKASLFAVEVAKGRKCPGGLGIVGSQGFLPDRERAGEQGLRLCEPFLRDVVCRERGQVGGNFRVIAAKQLFHDREPTQSQRLSIRLAPQIFVDAGQGLQGERNTALVGIDALFDGQSPAQARFRVCMARKIEVDVPEIEETLGNAGVIGSEGFFPNRERPQMSGLGFGIAALQPVTVAQIIERIRNVGMVGPEQLLAHGKRAAEHLVGLGEAAGDLIDEADAAQRVGDLRIGRAEPFLTNGKRLAERLLGIPIPRQHPIISAKIVEAVAERDRIEAGDLLPDCERLGMHCQCILIAPEQEIDCAEIVVALRCFRMAGRIDLLPELQRALEICFRLREGPVFLRGDGGIVVRVRERLPHGRVGRMFGTQ